MVDEKLAMVNSVDMKLAALVITAALLDGQGRLRPPDDVGCDRNELTSYAGVVTNYTRTNGRITVTINTDDATKESAAYPESRIRWRGGEFKPENWKQIEKGKTRAVAWVRTGGGGLLDFQ